MNKIGRYEIKSELGRGGMATVFKAYDPKFKRDVAIKMLPKEMMHDESFRARFEREATIIAALEHPAIVPVYDFGEQDGQPYIVMRYMHGGSLQDRIRKGALTISEAVEILLKLSPALDYAHGQDIVHRDIKPANILFDQLGEAYLSDFGIAKLKEASTQLTASGAITGTPAYMSPEQGRGEADLDGRSDVYSLGATLFEMLTGKVPFEANTPMGQVMKHLTEPVPDIHQINDALPLECQPIIAQAMAKRKFMRFATAMEMTKALEAVSRGEKLPDLVAVSDAQSQAEDRSYSHPATIPQPAQRMPTQAPAPRVAAKSQKSRWSWVVFAFLILVVGVGLGGVFGVINIPGVPALALGITNGDDVPAPTATLEPTHTITPTQTELPATPTEAAPVIVADTNTPEPTPTEEISLTLTDTPEPAPPTETPLPPTPSGPVVGGADKIAFISGADVWVSNVDGTELNRLTSSGGSKVSLQWTPDGQSLVFVAGRCVQSVNIETAQVSNILCANWAEYIGGFEISPDGDQVGLSSNDGFYVLPFDLAKISQIRTKEQLQAAEKCISYTDSAAKAMRWSRDGNSIAVVTEATLQGLQADLIRVFNINRCGQPPLRVDEFPSERFTMDRYWLKPEIVDFAWDGDNLFVLAVNTLNDYGEIYQYSLDTKKAEKIVPIEKRCCYRGFRWSPDGEYFVFAYQDQRYGEGAELFYVIYGTIGTGATYQPITFSEENILLGSRENPQPILRPVKP